MWLGAWSPTGEFSQRATWTTSESVAPLKIDSGIPECQQEQCCVLAHILCLGRSFRTAGGMATCQVPFQDASQTIGLVNHYACLVALWMGALHHKGRCREDANAAWSRQTYFWVLECYRWKMWGKCAFCAYMGQFANFHKHRCFYLTQWVEPHNHSIEHC